MKNKNTTKSKRVRVSAEFGEGSYGLRYFGIGPWTRGNQNLNEERLRNNIETIGKDTEWKLIEVFNKDGDLIVSLLYEFQPHGQWNCCGPFEYLMKKQFYIDIVTRLKACSSF